jgi:type III secretory pathway component EscU
LFIIHFTLLGFVLKSEVRKFLVHPINFFITFKRVIVVLGVVRLLKGLVW